MHLGEMLMGGPRATARNATEFVLEGMSFGRVLEESGPEILASMKTALTELFARNHSDRRYTNLCMRSCFRSWGRHLCIAQCSGRGRGAVSELEMTYP